MKQPNTPDEYWEMRDRRSAALRDNALFQNPTHKPMSMIKRYLENVVCKCSEERFGQDAVEWAIMSGHIQLTYHQDTDLRTIMGEPGQPDTGQYSTIIEAYQVECHKNEEVLMGSYAPLLEQINELPKAA